MTRLSEEGRSALLLAVMDGLQSVPELGGLSAEVRKAAADAILHSLLNAGLEITKMDDGE